MQIQFLKKLSSLLCLGMAVFGATFQATADGPVALLSPTNFWKYNDESVDLGTGWIATNYNDSAWSNGFSALGFRSINNTNYQLPPPNFIRTLTRVRTPTNANLSIMTFYFRTHFTFTNDPTGMTLTASNLIDDGAIFYLNGYELTRVAMPSGPVAWGTTATRGSFVGTSREPTNSTHGYDVFSVPVEALVQGDNVAAVEVHQVSPTNPTMAFQMELWANFPAPTQLTITNEPQDITIEEAKPFALVAGVSGAAARYQWYKQGSGPVPGAFASTYSVASGSTNDSGFYYLVATNLISAVTSRVARVSVMIDVNGPTLIDADGSLAPNTVLVSFSESILNTTATNVLNYQITNTLGGTLSISRAALTNATNVLITTTSNRVANNNYILIANGIRDSSPRTNLIVTNSMIPISNLGTIISLDDSGWRGYDPYPDFPISDPADLGTAWKEVNYVEGSTSSNGSVDVWGNGTSVFWLAQDQSSIPGPANTQLSESSAITSYFRFPLAGLHFSAGQQKVFLTYIFDDGAVLYLNGTEFFRFNMPAGAINYQTRASTQIPSPTRIGPVTLTNTFLQGTNVIAGELHQFVPIDTDKAFGFQLDAYVRSVVVGPAIITGGAFDVTVFEGQPATFTVIEVGGASFQWQQNSNNINGADSDIYVTPPAPLSLNGAKFRVTVNGAGGSVTSTNATLHVLPDTNAPALLAAFASTNSILVSFSEIMATATANRVTNYLVTNSVGQVFTPTAAVLTNGTNVTLSFASLPAAAYVVVVNNVRDASVAGNFIAPNSAVKAGFRAGVIGFADLWRYNQTTNDLTSQGWTNRTYIDSGWTGSGPGLLDGKAGGRNPATLPLPVGAVLLAPTNGPGGAYLNTTYFRAHFNSYSSGTGTITFRTVLDDAGVIYLNGVELTRIRMPAGPVNYATQGTGTSVGDATVEGPFVFAVSNLLGGDNVIAVDVHQIGAGSSDVTWGGEFSVSIPSLLITNSPVSCTNLSFALPVLRSQRVSGTNVILSWTNPVINSCGSNAVFTLQQALTLTNPPSLNGWSNVTTVSPYTAVGTNKSRFFRLKQ